MVARNNNADLYVSLHINDNKDTSVQGANVFVTSRTELPKYKEGMTILGNKILTNLNKLGIENDGVVNDKLCNDREPKYQYYDGSQADYYADIRHAMKGDTEDLGDDFSDGSGIPAVLIEHCYMNNSHDVQFLDSEEDLKKLAKADGDAIIDYLKLRFPKDVISTMTIDKESINLLQGEKAKVTATVGPNTAQNKEIKWTTSNEKVAKVDAQGNIETVEIGVAKITATSVDNPNVNKTVTVNVEKEEVKFEKETENILLGKSKTLDVKITPSWVENKNIVWESSNKDIVEVSNEGKITAKKEGTATIKVTWKDKNLSDEIKVNVVELSEDTKIEIKKYKTENNYISKIGEKVTKADFLTNIAISDDLKVEIENTDSKQELIGTNTKIKVKHKLSDMLIEEYTCLVYGDINGDGEIDAIDLLKIRRYLLAKEKINGTYYKAMNVYMDNDIDALDLLKLRRYLLGKDSIEQ